MNLVIFHKGSREARILRALFGSGSCKELLLFFNPSKSSTG